MISYNSAGNCAQGTATISNSMSDTSVEYTNTYDACSDPWDYQDFIDYLESLGNIYHPPVPMNIKPTKFAPRITNHIIKQPGPMRRGNRI